MASVQQFMLQIKFNALNTLASYQPEYMQYQNAYAHHNIRTREVEARSEVKIPFPSPLLTTNIFHKLSAGVIGVCH